MSSSGIGRLPENELIHEAMPFLEDQAAAEGGLFRKRGTLMRRLQFPLCCPGQGSGFAGVRPLHDGRQVITRHHDAVVFKRLQPLENRPYHALVKSLDGLYLFLPAAGMTGFIRGFHVNKNEVSVLEPA